MLQALTVLLFGARCNDIIERSPAKVIPHPHPSPLPSSTARTFPASWGGTTSHRLHATVRARRKAH